VVHGPPNSATIIGTANLTANLGFHNNVVRTVGSAGCSSNPTLPRPGSCGLPHRVGGSDDSTGAIRDENDAPERRKNESVVTHASAEPGGKADRSSACCERPVWSRNSSVIGPNLVWSCSRRGCDDFAGGEFVGLADYAVAHPGAGRAGG